MNQPPFPGSGQGIKIVKVPVPYDTYQQLQQQAQRLSIPVSAHLSPVLVAVGSGEIKPRYEQAAPPPATVAVTPGASIRERLLGIPRLTSISRAVLAYVVESFQAAGGKCVVDTNRELASATGFSMGAVSRCVGQLEVAGWLRTKLHAGGANGRQVWPTEKLLTACTP